MEIILNLAERRTTPVWVATGRAPKGIPGCSGWGNTTIYGPGCSGWGNTAIDGRSAGVRSLSEGGEEGVWRGVGNALDVEAWGLVSENFLRPSCVFVFLLLAFVIEKVLESGMAFV